ncbi:integrase, catalytic region, zinc finger, CCHC-type containing protein [Tanacetum coccineum]
MTTPSNNNHMHNDIMAAGSRERPPMLASGHYAQWSSRFMRYVDMKANKNKLGHCIEMGPYILTELVTEAVPVTKVNEICVEKIARNANPLALIAATQHCPDKYSPDTYYQAPKPHKTHTSSSIHTSSTSSHATTRNKSKEIAKLITPPSESPSEEDSDPEQAQRGKYMHKNLALIAKYIKTIYKPTNNNLRTSSNTKNKIVDTSPRSRNDRQTRQFRNQRTMTVARARETVGNQVVQQTGIQCFNCKEYGHFAKECRKLKRGKYYAYHKEKIMLCKQEEKGVLLSAEQGD